MVKLVNNFNNYNSGEICSFDDITEQILIKQGFAIKIFNTHIEYDIDINSNGNLDIKKRRGRPSIIK